VSGANAVVGAMGDGDLGEFTGSAYVIVSVEVEWTLTNKLMASDAAARDEFGRSVSVFGDTVFVGASGDDEGGSDSGAVYLFESTPCAADMNGDGAVDTRDFIHSSTRGPQGVIAQISTATVRSIRETSSPT
jgi:hypothetical protein